MALLAFGDRLADVQGHVRRLYKQKADTILVDSFLAKCYSALRDEVGQLPAEARAPLPVFNSILDLSERYSASRSRRSDISSALLAIAQLGTFISHLERHSEFTFASLSDVVVGLGIGQLCAAAVACASNVVDLVEPAVESVRLAFRTGSVVERISSGGSLSQNESAAWSIEVAASPAVVSGELQRVQDLLNIPQSERPYISIFGQNSCTISGRPQRLEQLASYSDVLTSPETRFSKSLGLWHSSQLYGTFDIENILSPRLPLLQTLKSSSKQVLSTSTAEPIQPEHADELFRRIVSDILTEPIRWETIQQTLTERTETLARLDGTIIGFASNPLVEDLAKVLQLTIVEDLSTVAAEDEKAGSSGTTQTISDIAIVGMSGRFPGAPDVEAFWKVLQEGRDMHKKIPKDRFNVETHVDPSGKKNNTSHTPYGCFIEEPGLFDPRFFNMSPREAAQTDPMHRLALVTAYEALEQSGFVLNRTPSSQADRVGTFYGQTSDDWREVNAAQRIETYFIPGGVRAFAPGRISYYFGFRGPSYSVDTACSSSLAAIQVACTSLRSAECDTAIAGGLNVLTAPDIFAGLSRGQFLSKTGPCKTWDSQADGYCRADGVGSIVMKRLEDAIADKDPILGVIRGTATNHSADAVSITHPHAGNQSYLYTSVLNSAGIDPDDISYVEMHGTGTQAGDLTEIRSVTDVFASEEHPRRDGNSLHIGAVKSNVGHGEAAAGITALIKILLMMQKNAIPPHVGIKNGLNPGFPDLQSRQVQIPFQQVSWKRPTDRPRIAFLNNFSAAGGNTALILQDGPLPIAAAGKDPRSSFPIVISAKSISSLQRNIKNVLAYLQKHPETSLASLSYTLSSRRIHHSYRVGVAASTISELQSALQNQTKIEKFSPVSSKLPKVVFVFTGQGAFYSGLGKQLYQHASQFRADIQHFDQIAVAQGLKSIIPAIEGSTSAAELSAVETQLTLVCVQMALVRLWRCLGVKPDSVIGHSLGEYAALHAAGVLSANEVISLVGQRAKLLEQKCAPNTHGMLAVKASVAAITSAAPGLAFEVACINSAEDTTVCGLMDNISKVSEALTSAGIKNIKLDLAYAFHSSQIEPVLEQFELMAGGAIFNRPQIPVISTLLGEVVTDPTTFSPSYLCRHAREPVNFAGGVIAAMEQGLLDEKAILIEIGPHPICTNMIKATTGSASPVVPSLRKAEDPWKTLSSSLAAVHSIGLVVDWHYFHQDNSQSHDFLALPQYSFDNKNYWIDYENDWCLDKIEPRITNVTGPVETAPLQPVSKLRTSTVHRVVSEVYEDDKARVIAQSDMSEPVLRNAVLGHMVNGAGLTPSTILADIALTMGEYVFKQARPEAGAPDMNCCDMEVMKPLLIKKKSTENQVLQVTVSADFTASRAQVHFASVDSQGKETVMHAKCVIRYEDKSDWLERWNPSTYLIEGRIEILKGRLKTNQADQISRGLAYKLFAALVEYAPKYHGMEEVILDSSNFEATARVKFQPSDQPGTYYCNPVFLDNVSHITGFILNGSDAIDSKKEVYINHGWKTMRFAKPLNRETTYNTYVRMQPTGNLMIGDVYVFEGSEIIGVCGGVRFQKIPRAVLNFLLPPERDSEVKPKPAAAKTPKSGAVTPAKVASATAPTQETIKPQRPAGPKRMSSTATSRRLKLASDKVSASLMQAKNLVADAMAIIAQEADLPPSELTDDCEFSNLGVDSLLSLQICGKFREVLDLDVSSHAFLDHPTVGELQVHLESLTGSPSGAATAATTTTVTSEAEDSDDSEVSESSMSSVSSTRSVKFASVPAPPAAITTEVSAKGADVIMLFRETIAEEMGIDIEEVTGSNDLPSLGMDSLMSIAVLGALREKTDLDLPGHLFQDHPSIDAIEKFLGLNKPTPSEAPKRPPMGRRKSSMKKDKTSPSTTHSEPQAVSILMQGKPKTATKALFLFPDGSGSATSYAAIPNIDPSVCVWGLNCPYMTTPEDYTNGIPGVAAQFLAEVRRRQPHGPYTLGGWSAGGVVAYEVTLQLRALGERVDRLVLFDSPCPIRLEPLPSRLHHFFADVGLLGGDGPEPPSWLLPHFEASIKALTAYQPAALPDVPRDAPRTLAIWARHGVCRFPDDPRPPERDDDPKSMRWLLNNRTNFGPNGWENLLDKNNMEFASLDGNHFTMMKGAEQLRAIAGLVRRFLCE